MAVASIVHLYVFPAKPYEQMGDVFSGTVAVLGDYVSPDCPVDPDEVRDSERRPIERVPQPDVSAKSSMTLGQSVRDVFLGGGGYVSTFHNISWDYYCACKTFNSCYLYLQFVH